MESNLTGVGAGARDTTGSRKFCSIHGAALVRKEGCYFDPFTGAKIWVKVCPVCAPCDHIWAKLPWWHLVHSQKCIKCGTKQVDAY